MELICQKLPTMVSIESITKYFKCIISNIEQIKNIESVYSRLNSDKGFFKMAEVQQLIILNKISYNKRTLNLKKDIYLNSCYECGMYVLENKNLNILSYGENFEEALIGFQEDFLFLWDEIAKSRDENLSYDAIELKQTLLLIVKSEE